MTSQASLGQLTAGQDVKIIKDLGLAAISVFGLFIATWIGSVILYRYQGLDDVEVTPEAHWRTPQRLIDGPVLKRSSKAVQLPTGGALYFDGGVIEAPASTSRAAAR